MTVPLPRRSAGLKLLLVCGLALLMTIPALFVFALVAERTDRAESVAREIGGRVGGRQTFLGPVLAVPYSKTVAAPAPQPGQVQAQPTLETGVIIVFPETGDAQVRTSSDVRRRSLFNVPVYTADVAFRAAFDLSRTAPPDGAVMHWEQAELLVGASDPRGALTDIAVTVAGQRIGLAPATSMSDLSLNATDRGEGAPGPNMLRFSGAPVGAITRADARFDVAAQLRFSGAERVAVLPFAKTTTIAINGQNRSDVTLDPSFDGGFIPATRNVRENAFDARWSIPFVARGVPGAGGTDLLQRLGPGAVGVSLVEPANPYQAVGRSLKYAILFIGLVFLTFFVFETTTRRRVHPAQYILVGLAQVIFYLLLLAIAERLGFDLAFLIAAVATVSLISAYAAAVFDSRTQALRAFVVFGLLYAGIYVLMRLEDFALLVGSVAAFAAVAAVMYATRRIDWYGLGGDIRSTPQPAYVPPANRTPEQPTA